MSLRFLLFSAIYVSSKAFKSCERQSLDHSESTASLLELVQVCLWCLKVQNILFRRKGKSETPLTVREQLRRAEKWNINLSVKGKFLSCCSVRDHIQIQKARKKSFVDVRSTYPLNVMWENSLCSCAGEKMY